MVSFRAKKLCRAGEGGIETCVVRRGRLILYETDLAGPR